MNPESETNLVEWDFRSEQKKYDSIISSWTQENDKIKKRRELRRNMRNVSEERQKGTILPDETIIPDRTINLNISKQAPAFVSYVTQARRLLVMTDIVNPGRSTESIEYWFTRGMRYPNWSQPWYREIDSILVHGGCAMEVMYDTTKPFNCGIEWLRRSELMFPLKTRDIQACPRILREYSITPLQLENFSALYGFLPSTVSKIMDQYQEREDFIKIYRVLCKKNGIVYNCWYSILDTDTWLRTPVPHQIGLYDIPYEEIGDLYLRPEWILLREQFMFPAQLKEYPIFWFPYEDTEDDTILETQGRVSLDLHVQEAMTHLLSNTVNASTRASHLYPTAEGEPGDSGKLEEIGRIKPGVVMSRKIMLNEFPWPNSIILAIMQALQIGKAAEAGNQDFATLARKDANKTATEMQLAQQSSQIQRATSLGVFATPFLNTYGLCFEIARQQAFMMLCPRPEAPELLTGAYSLQPAGDIEIVKRLEDRETATRFFQLIQGTPLAERLIVFLIQHYFPDQANQWIRVLESQEANKDAIIQQLVEILQTVPTEGLDDNQRAQLQSVISAASSMAGPAGNAVTSEQLNNAAGPAAA